EREGEASVAESAPPEENGYGPEVAWLSVDIRKKVLDEESATMVAEPEEVKLTDRAGRTWVVELRPGDRPTDRLEVGREYRIEGVAVVPAAVKYEVGLVFRASTGRAYTRVVVQ